jgi:type I restriction enzyme S subunit
MTPQLRFPEFTDEWQMKKLGDIFEFKRTNSLSRAQLSEDGKVGNIHYGDIHKSLPTLLDASKVKLPMIVSSKQFNTADAIKVGDVILADAFEDYADIGKVIEVVNLNHGQELYSGLHTFLMRPAYPSAHGFNGMLFKTATIRKQLMRIATGISVLGVSKNNVSQLVVATPSKPEQEKIADFLTAVDEWIGVGEEKLELLETYKRGVMQKIFSQQIRFKDENGNPYPDWEEKKLGEVSKIKTGDSDVQDAVADGDYPFFIRSKEVKRSNKYIYDGEAILIPGEGGIGEIFHYINGKFNYHQRVYKISDFDAKTHGKYVLYFIHQNFARQANKHSVKATVDSLRLPTFTDFSVSLPCKEEQQKIATFLTALDDKIKAEQTRLTAAKQWKKGLLQRMFV